MIYNVDGEIERWCQNGLCVDTDTAGRAPERRSWHEAQQYCENNGGTLLNIVNIDMENRLKLFFNLLGFEENNWWIGISSVSTTSEAQFHRFNESSISGNVD